MSSPVGPEKGTNKTLISTHQEQGDREWWEGGRRKGRNSLDFKEDRSLPFPFLSGWWVLCPPPGLNLHFLFSFLIIPLPLLSLSRCIVSSIPRALIASCTSFKTDLHTYWLCHSEGLGFYLPESPSHDIRVQGQGLCLIWTRSIRILKSVSLEERASVWWKHLHEKGAGAFGQKVKELMERERLGSWLLSKMMINVNTQSPHVNLYLCNNSSILWSP